MADREPHAGPGGVVARERIEDARTVFLRDAAAGVANLDRHAAARTDARHDADLVPFRLSLGNGLRGVDDEVQQHLGQARLVRMHRRHVAVLLHQPGPAADLVPGQVDDRIEEAPHVDGAVPVVVEAGEHPQVPHHLADPVGSVTGLAERVGEPVDPLPRQRRTQFPQPVGD